MKTKNQLIGRYFLAASAVVCVISIILYSNVFAQSGKTRLFLGLAFAAAAVSMGVSFLPTREIPNMIAGLFCILVFIGFCVSISPMVEPIAYWYAGLYDSGTVSGYFGFATAWGITWILSLICLFTGIGKSI